MSPRANPGTVLRDTTHVGSDGEELLLDVRGLSVEYDTPNGSVRAVDKVDLQLRPGEFLGVVGESGCGKSTMLFAIAQLLNPPARIAEGSVTFAGRNLVTMTASELAPVRWRQVSVVMQSAMNALNPVKRIGAQFADAMKAHGVRSRTEIADRSREVMRLVGIDATHLTSYPHQLSGGMRQRAMIAMALLFTPELVIMDEPTSALDVVAQRSLMLQIKELQQQLGFAVVFVTHDMSLVSHFSDRLMVMYAGQAVEVGPTREVFDTPRHPYSIGLLDAFPSIRGPRVPLTGIPGAPPALNAMPPGCRFAPRCPRRFDDCDAAVPPLYRIGTAPQVVEAGAEVEVRCLLHRDGAREPEPTGPVPTAHREETL
ncbi:peptide/nickel transport system ATP-binding protein [Friedmanniella endophytica]|uniref:Peptide/nickel transport system ATP-binding protein n=1 Tax=Microlunatus kandeliicorticis TaxID=1759536 RepID=A0A7W3IQU7_9ACTN|nr:ABC transporter ATP-binding protein [Microlunatus kandeliicorticis]MBA8793550.1 peptide/nickel transport system ATP-binding protein [Microlunatus kandeliicorticis]